jgi:phosphatidylserine decarboxylase
MRDHLAVLPQYLMPKRGMTALAGHIARYRGKERTHQLIRWFIKRYGVDMNEALNPEPSSYDTFNAFFTRALLPGVRPMAQADLVCPVDGAISQFGAITERHIFQAKRHCYTVQSLLGGDLSAAIAFDNGSFITLYLSPRDYHRVHMPCAGRLLRMTYVPGDLFSVNPTTVRGVPDLFARNERVICLFDSDFGPFALVLVGATIVGSMATVWHGVVNAQKNRSRTIQAWDYSTQNIILRQGEEMGQFLLGSTVVMLFNQTSALRFTAHWAPAGPVKLGEMMAQSTRS